MSKKNRNLCGKPDKWKKGGKEKFLVKKKKRNTLKVGFNEYCLIVYHFVVYTLTFLVLSKHDSEM